MTNSVVKISMMSAKYFEYHTIILRGRFFLDTLYIRTLFAAISNTLRMSLEPIEMPLGAPLQISTGFASWQR